MHRQLFAVILAVLLSCAAISISTHAQSPHWVAAWSTTQETLASTTITNRTIREMARVTIAGSAVRLRLDNTFGTTPVTIGTAYVGAQLVKRSGDSSSRGAGLVAGSNRQVFFDGAPGVVIPAGGSIKSDAVTMPVIAGQDLAVSLYVPDTSAHPSAHVSAQARGYMTANDAGDLASAESKSAFTSEITGTFWLKAIDVLSATSRGAVVAFGDSITDGTCSTFDGHDRWVDWLATRFDGTYGAAAKAIVNEGLGGNTLTTLRANSGSERLERDVLSQSGATGVLLFMGTNDIAKGATTSQVTAAMTDIANRVRAQGLRIFAATLIPRYDIAPAGSWTSAKTQIRKDVNQWIRTSAAFDGVVDFDKAVRDPANPDFFLRQYSCDDIHATPRGYYQMGKAVDLTLLN